MPTSKQRQTRIVVKGARAGVERGEPGGRAQRGGGAAGPLGGPSLVGLEPEVRDRLRVELVDELPSASAGCWRASGTGGGRRVGRTEER